MSDTAQDIQSARRMIQHFGGIKINANTAPLLAFMDRMAKGESVASLRHSERDLLPVFVTVLEVADNQRMMRVSLGHGVTPGTILKRRNWVTDVFYLVTDRIGDVISVDHIIQQKKLTRWQRVKMWFTKRPPQVILPSIVAHDELMVLGMAFTEKKDE